MSSCHVLLFNTSLFPCLFLGGSEVFVLFCFSFGSGVFYSVFQSRFFPNSYLLQQWCGSWKSEHRMTFSLLDSNIFRNNTSPKGPHLQRELSKVHFIRAANDWERIGVGDVGVILHTISFTCKFKSHLPLLDQGQFCQSAGAKVTSQRSLWSSGSTAVHKNCSNICSIKVHMVSISFTALLPLLCLCTNLPYSEFLLCWAPSATELGVR